MSKVVKYVEKSKMNKMLEECSDMSENKETLLIA